MGGALQSFATFINQVGFPAFVALLLILEVRQMHRDNTSTMRRLAQELAGIRAILAKLPKHS
jgi:hypothetical protein